MTLTRRLIALSALPLTAGVFLLSSYIARTVPWTLGDIFPRSMWIHLSLLILSMILMMLFSRNRLDLCGFTMGRFQFKPKLLLWLIPTAIPATLAGILAPEVESSHPVGSFSVLQSIVFVWFLASIAEEIAVRGLFQSLAYSNFTGSPTGKWYRLSLQVIVSGLLFGGMHLGLIRSMGEEAVPVVVFTSVLGVIAAKYRETTGSIVPAILIHMMFNIGGQLPGWIIGLFR